jgi:light-regulated signal transduction histidine kinase (bacteriophytochrome)
LLIGRTELEPGEHDLVGRFALAPAFGQVDLSNCELEQIHLAGSIQPSGALIVAREPDLVIVQASENAAAFLGVRDAVPGRRLAALPGDLATRIAPHLAEPLDVLPAAVRCRIGDPPAEFDGLLHRPPAGGLVIELERAGPAVDLSRDVGRGLRAILGSGSLQALCDEAARIVRGITGYDRVMIYRFDEAGHGQVIAEERRPEIEAFLGNRYPASDIPQIARRLYERNRVRVLADIGYTPVPLTPVMSPMTGAHLDMSLCFLRSVSPIHVQYLKNMGVAATLVASVMVGGRLWGLISCHHYQPRMVHFEVRAVCELLAEALATRIAALESFAQGQAEIAVRRLEQRMIEAISSKGDWRSALFDSTQAVLRPLGASGAALLFEGDVLTVGDTPGTPQLRAIGAWLDQRPAAPVHATASLGLDAPQFAAVTSIASGIVAAQISNTPGEYLIWFRPERVRTVTWGGDPHKPVVIGDNPRDLSPRRSFAQWHQIVERTCEPWTTADITAARLIGDTVTDVVLQFRAVGTLVAQDQLEQVRAQVEHSDQPVVIGNAQGRIILANAAFKRMLPANFSVPPRIDDLASCCAERAETRRRLADLIANKRAWRGEIALRTENGGTLPLLVRADPVFSTPTRVLGFVLLFTDLTERRAGEAARRSFQERIVAGHRMVAGPIESAPDLLFQTLLSTIVENAQLAALEITDGADLAHMPELLESVRASVARAAEVLEHLIQHSSRSAGKEG